ncbi:hypothetical protein [Streptomyces sp. CB01881]|uniref:hypothetical protein n=1 Tax=Streptomyces sp. CB01881 TaxID=2078691 RepID=UPI000CDC65FB|nr:hypothetical protein [Streptomyces sp. CB01881]AUY48320.1 hypothetical protein C2142_04345 [Streptomyces sp. CB01881]TYC76807.1 hypothetical protein EH183_04355 [Streptomyces sp. CB01881]
MTRLAAIRDQAYVDSAERLAALLEQTSPATRARQAQATVLPVLEPLARLLPHGGLAKGTITEATDMSLLRALAAGPAIADDHAWTAAVGLPDLGLAAADGYGIDLRRLVVADHPGEHLAEVVTALASACTVVLAAAPTGLAPRALERLAAQLRRNGTVLITPGPWPGAQLRLEVSSRRWFRTGGGSRAADRPAGAGDGVGAGFGVAFSCRGAVAAGRERLRRRGGGERRRREAAGGHGGRRLGVVGGAGCCRGCAGVVGGRFPPGSVVFESGRFSRP